MSVAGTLADQSGTDGLIRMLSLGIGHGSIILVFLAVLYPIALALYRITFHPLAQIPGPKLLAISGLYHQYHCNIQGDWHNEMVKLHKQYGPIVRIAPNHIAMDGSIGWSKVYASRLEDNREFNKIPNYLSPGDYLSLLASPRDVHRRQRKQLNHAFSDAALKEQEPLITKYINMFIQKLAEHAAVGKSLNIVNWLNFTTFDIIGDLTYADSFGCLASSDYHPWVFNLFHSILGGALNRFLKAYPFAKPVMALTGAFKSVKMAEGNVHLASEKAKERMALGEVPPDGRRDFMTYMMRKTRDGTPGLTEMEIFLNSSAIIAAGSETTATGLSGFFFILLQQPHVYKLLTDEVRGTFKSEEEITMNSTQQLQYLQACIEETLRVYPPAAETPPRVSPGAEIDGNFLPRGVKTSISVYQWATFHNPANFADPDEFRPERWLPTTHPLFDTKYAHDNKHAFKPFSYGPRDCIGKNLAYSEMRVIVARVLYRFDLELCEGQLDWQVVQRTYLVWDKGPLYLRLKDLMKS